MTSLVDRLAVARGDVVADLVFRNAQLVNVWSGEIYQTDIAIYQGRVVARCGAVAILDEDAVEALQYE